MRYKCSKANVLKANVLKANVLKAFNNFPISFADLCFTTYFILTYLLVIKLKYLQKSSYECVRYKVTLRLSCNKGPEC